MESCDYLVPTDKEIALAQETLGLEFHPDYVEFIKSGYDMGDSILQPLEINSTDSCVNIFEAVKVAWDDYGVPRNLLPIVEDNADYYCLATNGEVCFWSHDGVTDEKWVNIKAWCDQMHAEANE